MKHWVTASITVESTGSEMGEQILYHGASGDKILGILRDGAMRPSDGKIYFARHNYQNAFMHGGDLNRSASFVIKVRIKIPNDVVTYLDATAGVPDTLVVQTATPIHAEVLELFARKRGEDGFEVTHIKGAEHIKLYLR